MNLENWIELAFLILVIFLLAKPLGLYISKILNPKEKTFLDFIFKPFEKFLYRACGINPDEEQTWKEYLSSILIFSAMGFLFLFLILQFQYYLPLNPEKLKGMSFDAAINTTVSFITNTNWQCYIPEKSLSYFSQMAGLTVQNFLSAGVGISVAAALTRGISRYCGTTLGNFWVDIVRIVLYLLLPLSILTSVFFVSQGVPQNFKSYISAKGLENKQVIVAGPVASQESIKLIGSNGGGYFGANSSHPYENPTPLSNFIQILCILIIPASLTYYFGKEIQDKKHGWSLLIVMILIFIGSVFFCATYESKGSLFLNDLNQSSSNMEGKEVRFGTFDSALFSVATTAVSCGAVNSSLDSYTPIGGFIPMLNILLGDGVFGAVGSGISYMIIFVIITIFLAGLIVGRTPEYLQKKIEADEVKTCILATLIFYSAILGLSSFAFLSNWGENAVFNKGPHGISEILYAYASTTANNGSSFGGLASNPMINYTTSFAMLVGRYGIISLVVFLANLFLKKKKHPKTVRSFPFSGPTFILLLTFVIILVGVMTFIPAIVLGPILEQFNMYNLIFF